MLGQVFRCPSVLERIRANPLGNWLRDYSAYLDERGHPRTSSRNMLELSSISAPWAPRNTWLQRISHRQPSVRLSTTICPRAVVLVWHRPRCGTTGPF